MEWKSLIQQKKEIGFNFFLQFVLLFCMNVQWMLEKGISRDRADHFLAMIY